MITIITTWTSLIQPFLIFFTQPGGAIFTQLISGWVLCSVRRTVTGMLPYADPDGRQAHDAFHRFFPDARWTMVNLWRALAIMLCKTFYRTGTITLALDDTLFHHSGPKINGAGYWRDAVRSTKAKTVFAWGLNLVVLTLQIQLPWGGEPRPPARLQFRTGGAVDILPGYHGRLAQLVQAARQDRQSDG